MKLGYLGVLVVSVFAGVAMAASVNQSGPGASQPSERDANTAIVDSGGSLRLVDEEDARRLEQERQAQLGRDRQGAPPVPDSFQNPVSSPNPSPAGTPMVPDASDVPTQGQSAPIESR